jgi:hypothetical protein
MDYFTQSRLLVESTGICPIDRCSTCVVVWAKKDGSGFNNNEFKCSRASAVNVAKAYIEGHNLAIRDLGVKQ